ncbi:MAG: sigma-70 family RNA polymerase sigma factor [Proteobacteria bacterium]|nr:sigma-70 family RNA polymerase sigma factor [Pseudomonadota bacterium]
MTKVELNKPDQPSIETIIRQNWGVVLASLIATLKDIDLAEDVLQDAILMALQKWQAQGVPEFPRAWLLRTARNKAIDIMRRKCNFDKKIEQIFTLKNLEGLSKHSQLEENNHTFQDKRLMLIFTCCHPALAQNAKVALTLRVVCGLSTTEIARAFMVSEKTMAQRLVRVKRKIKSAGIPYQIPAENYYHERLNAVLTVIYLIFNEGYLCTNNIQLFRGDLCDESIYLAKILYDLLPNEAEVLGLLALMLLHDSRRFTRTSAEGKYLTLEQQNRKNWDQIKIKQGDKLLKQALSLKALGPYQLQAAISAVHAQAKDFATTNWQQILLLYQQLLKINPSPVIKLNAIVAMSYAKGVKRAYKALQNLESQGLLKNYQPFYACKADFLYQLGKYQSSSKTYKKAIKLTDNQTEKDFLRSQLSRISL